KQALLDHQITYDPRRVLSSRLMEADGYASAEKLLTNGIDIDGIFAANDVSAIGAVKYLKKNDKKIPDDVAIVGFSNEPISEVIEPSLTTIDQSGFEIGKMACDLLIHNIQSGDNLVHNKTIILNPTLIERESSNRKTGI